MPGTVFSTYNNLTIKQIKICTPERLIFYNGKQTINLTKINYLVQYVRASEERKNWEGDINLIDKLTRPYCTFNYVPQGKHY